MNLSSVNSTSVGGSRDSFTIAVVKNVIITFLCIIINYINGIQVQTFRDHQVWKILEQYGALVANNLKCLLQIFSSNPRYILFIHLVVNNMIQLVLSTLLHIISHAIYTINVPFCLLLLVVAVVTTLNTPLNLACMAVECYVAVCLPLRHAAICTVEKTYVLIGLIWLASASSILPDVFFLLATGPLHLFYSRVLCIREVVFTSSFSKQKREISHIIYLVLVWLTLFYTYFGILSAARGANADTVKARNTILLHGFQLLLCMLSYISPIVRQGLTYLLPNHSIAIRFIFYIFIHILPRFLTPIVYGLRDQAFRRHMKRRLLCRARREPGKVTA